MQLRKILIYFIVFSLFIPSSWAASKKLKKSKKKYIFTAASAIIVNLDNDKIIYKKDIYAKHEPASTLKLLTALIALEDLGIKKGVKVSKKATLAEPSKIWLTEGATFNSLDLVKAALMSSANDACVAIAEAVSGSESEFANAMNKRAKKLGAKSSNFVNASGLPAKKQYTTAYDLYRIAKTALDNPVIYNIMKTRKCSINGDQGSSINLRNHNKLLFRKKHSDTILVKTGYTKSARHCYAGVVYIGNKRYAIVILRSRKPWADIASLVDFIKKH